MTPEEITLIYSQFNGLLTWIAQVKFKLPDYDADVVVQEAMMAFLQANTRVVNVRSWLIGATCNGCKAYWRVIARERLLFSSPDDHGSPPDAPYDEQFSVSIERQTTVTKLLARLTEQHRTVLRLHYFEGHTVSEIAQILNISERYALKLTHVALKKARIAYALLVGGQATGAATDDRGTPHRNEGVTERRSSLPPPR